MLILTDIRSFFTMLTDIFPTDERSWQVRRSLVLVVYIAGAGPVGPCLCFELCQLLGAAVVIVGDM
jgi:threonine dehydrogenase-like Zn-dependent dehydrogenase